MDALYIPVKIAISHFDQNHIPDRGFRTWERPSTTTHETHVFFPYRWLKPLNFVGGLGGH